MGGGGVAIFSFDVGVVSPFCLAEKSKYHRSLLLLVSLRQKVVVFWTLRSKTPKTGRRVGRQALMIPTLVSTLDQLIGVTEDPEVFQSVR